MWINLALKDLKHMRKHLRQTGRLSSEELIDLGRIDMEVCIAEEDLIDN